MNPQEYANVFQEEERHWWYRGMWRISSTLLARHCGPPWGAWRVLDAGCGTGGALRELAPYGVAFGVDNSPIALGFARCRGQRSLAQASVEALPFRDGSFELAVCFDVLYHRAVSDDAAALRELARVLMPGGWLLLRLPAYGWLRSAHDACVHTARRYTAEEAGRLVAGAGLSLRRVTYANALLFGPIALRRLLGRAFGTSGSDVGAVPGPLNVLLEAVLAAEARWLREHDFPFGLSVVALARKSGQLPTVGRQLSAISRQPRRRDGLARRPPHALLTADR